MLRVVTLEHRTDLVVRERVDKKNLRRQGRYRAATRPRDEEWDDVLRPHGNQDAGPDLVPQSEKLRGGVSRGTRVNWNSRPLELVSGHEALLREAELVTRIERVQLSPIAAYQA